MLFTLLAAACSIAPLEALSPGIALARAECGPARAGVIRAGPGARLLVSSPGPSRTVAQFAAAISAVAAVNGELFDARERPMGPARGAGRGWPALVRGGAGCTGR
jgi:hypothetical protein